MIMYGLGYDLAFLRYFPEVKTEKWNQKDWSESNRIGIIRSCSSTYFLVHAFHWKFFLEVKRLLNLGLLDYFSDTENEECDQEDRSVSDKLARR